MSRHLKTQHLVLIDDDILVREAWQRRLDRTLVQFKAFQEPQHLERELNLLPKSSTIFVDQFLDGGQLGIEYARSLFDRGYSQIYLCSADPFVSQYRDSWIQGVVDKSPPVWWLQQSLFKPLTLDERKAYLSRMNEPELELYRSRMAKFEQISLGEDSGLMPFGSLDGFSLPAVVLQAWERAITEGLSDPMTQARLDDAWGYLKFGVRV